MFKFQQKNIFSIFIMLFFINLFALSSAYISEYFFDILPCTLCLYQRYILIAITFIIFLFLLFKNFKYQFWQLTVLKFSYGVSFCFAVYQVLVEEKIVPLPLFCKKEAIDLSALQSFTATFSTIQRHVSCDIVSWKLLGISFAGYGAIFSLLISIYLFCFAYKLKIQNLKNYAQKN